MQALRVALAHGAAIELTTATSRARNLPFSPRLRDLRRLKLWRLVEQRERFSPRDHRKERLQAHTQFKQMQPPAQRPRRPWKNLAGQDRNHRVVYLQRSPSV